MFIVKNLPPKVCLSKEEKELREKIKECITAWLEALKVAGYSDERIDELKRKL